MVHNGQRKGVSLVETGEVTYDWVLGKELHALLVGDAHCRCYPHKNLNTACTWFQHPFEHNGQVRFKQHPGAVSSPVSRNDIEGMHA